MIGLEGREQRAEGKGQRVIEWEVGCNFSVLSELLLCTTLHRSNIPILQHSTFLLKVYPGSK